jgi:hypothetical protein
MELMRFLRILAGLILLGHAAIAQPQCSSGGLSYSDGASFCFPAMRDGRVQQGLFTCKNGVWTDANAACPERFAYFCQIGPHAIPTGERLLLGFGPAALECKFPGVLSIDNPLVSASAPGSQPALGNSRLVRNVQQFLSEENAGLDCSGQQCDGQIDAKTLSSVISYVRQNFRRLKPEERKKWGVESQDQVEIVIRSKSPLDVIYLFVETFDVRRG